VISIELGVTEYIELFSSAKCINGLFTENIENN